MKVHSDYNAEIIEKIAQNAKRQVNNSMQVESEELIDFNSSNNVSSPYDKLLSTSYSSESTDSQTTTTAAVDNSGIAALEAQYEETQKSKGWFGKAIDGICNFFGTKNSSKKVKETIEKAKKGEISLEEAAQHVGTHAQKAKSVTNTWANIITGVAVVVGVVAAPFTGGASLALGAGIGAAVKVGIKASDAATNDIEGDYGAKEVFKDAATGALSGVVTAATAGVGAGGTVVKEGGKVLVGQTIKNGIVQGAKVGAIDGAVLGAGNYTVEAIAEEDVDFTMSGLVGSTANGAINGAVAGGVAGGVSSGFGALTATRASSTASVAGKEVSEEIIDDTSKGVVKEGTEEITEEATKVASADATKEVADKTIEETSKKFSEKTFGEMTSSAKTAVATKINKLRSLKNMTPADVRSALTGKANASVAELKKAYEQIMNSNIHDVETRLLLERAFAVGATETV